MDEKREIEDMAGNTLEEGLKIQDEGKSLKYLKENFEGMEKSGYDLSEYKKFAYEIIFEGIMKTGVNVMKRGFLYESARYIGNKFREIQKEGIDTSDYNWIHTRFFKECLPGIYLN